MRYMVCADGSAGASKALEKVAALAKGHEGDTVTVVNIYEYPKGSLLAGGAATALNVAAAAFMPTVEEDSNERQEYFEEGRELEQQASAVVREACDTLMQLGVAKTQLRPLHEVCDDVRSRIVELAEKEKVDVVVIGTRGLGVVSRLLLGSVSHYVVHHAPCAVLVAR